MQDQTLKSQVPLTRQIEKKHLKLFHKTLIFKFSKTKRVLENQFSMILNLKNLKNNERLNGFKLNDKLLLYVK